MSNEQFTPDSSYSLLIGGEWLKSDSGETIDSINPATGEVLTKFQKASEADVNKAVIAAKMAFKAWGKTSRVVRQDALLKIADLLEQSKEKFAQFESMEVGKPITEATQVDIPIAVDHFRYFAGVIRTHSDEANMLDEQTLSISLSEPLGVVGQIIPWNYPLLMASWKIAPAIASGNCVVIKPSEMTSITMIELGKIITQVLPPGVVNIVTGLGTECGQALLDHPGIDKLAFTGSTGIGYKVAEAAAKKLIPATLELGGKSANIVFPDANIDRALDCSIMSILLNQGQVCESGARLFLHDDIYDDFISSMKKRFEGVRQGAPSDPRTQMGCQVSEIQMNRILGYIDLAKEEGASILTGGKRNTKDGMDKGFFIEPTIISDADNSMKVSQEEIFGPVIVVIRFKTEEEVLQMANTSDYGLAGGVWTQDINRAIRIARGVQTGRMWVNTYHALPAHTHFGGYKKSGLGRECHKSMMAAYSETKHILISLNEKSGEHYPQ